MCLSEVSVTFVEVQVTCQNLLFDLERMELSEGCSFILDVSYIGVIAGEVENIF
jgi:hypothetical protein